MVEPRDGEFNVKTVNLIAKVKGSNPVLAFFTTAKETAMIFFTFNFNCMNFTSFLHCNEPTCFFIVTNQLHEQLVQRCTSIAGGGGGGGVRGRV